MLNINYYVKRYWEAQSDEFKFVDYESHFDKDNLCNIYMIGSRPRVCIDPDYIKEEKDKLKLKFRIQRGFDFKEEFKVSLPKPNNYGKDIVIDSKFPHSRFTLKTADGMNLLELEDITYKDRKVKSFYTLRGALDLKSQEKFSDLEIHYIGKSLKMHKTISPIKRLNNHKHIQRVLEKCNKEMPDKEIYIMLCSFVRKVNLIETNEELKKLGKSNDEIFDELGKYYKQYDDSIELTTMVSEAALIDHFNTCEFNTDYIGSFGNKRHAYYKNIINGKVDRIGLEIDFSSTGVRVFSKDVKPKYHHMVQYLPNENFKKAILT